MRRTNSRRYLTEMVLVASPLPVLQELQKGDDDLKVWSKGQEGNLFLPPTDAIQEVFRQVADNVISNSRYARRHTSVFLDGADPWVIAYAKALGGRVVTFEKREPLSRKPKIPDVATDFEVDCVNLWDVLAELGASF